MQNFKLQQLFGKNVAQDEESLIISKIDLERLTASEDNRAEQLFVALILQVWDEFQGLIVDEIGENLVDETGEAIGYEQRGLYEKLGVYFWRRQLTQAKVLDILIVDIYIEPLIGHGVELTADLLNYV